MFDETDAPRTSDKSSPYAPSQYLAEHVLPWLAPLAEQAWQLHKVGLTLQGNRAVRERLQKMADQGDRDAALVLYNLTPEPEPKLAEPCPCSIGMLVGLAGVVGLILGWFGGTY